MRRIKLWPNVCLILSVLLNALPLAAQTAKPAAAARPLSVGLSLGAGDPVEAFRMFRRGGGDGVFSQLLEKMVGKESEDAEGALEAQAVNFYESFASATKGDLAKTEKKAKEISEKRYAQLKQGRAQEQPSARSVSRRGGPSVDGDESLDAAPESSASGDDPAATYAARTSTVEDSLRVETAETESSVAASASDTKEVDLAAANIKRTEDAGLKQSFDGKTFSAESEQTERIDAVSKTDDKKVGRVNKLSWSASLDVCPDASGVVRGHGKAVITTQTTVNFGSNIAAMTRDLTVEFAITGYVNDDAVFAHFDMKGESAETLNGYDRARERGLAQPEDGWSDGTRRLIYDVSDSKPPQTVPGEYSGATKTLGPVFGTTRVSSPDALTEAQVKRIADAAGTGLTMMREHLDALMLSLNTRLESGECVDVECSAPKTELQPGESVEVTTVSRSKQDLSKFNAKIEAVGEDITPPKQLGTPTAVFTFTAPSGGGGDFSVKSVSRRGIGLGWLQFAKADKEEACDGNWHGTVEIRRSFEQVMKETTKPGDVPSDLQMSGYKETVNRQTYTGEVKVTVPKLNTASVSLLAATYSASGERYYLSHNFWMEPGDCGWYKKTTTKDDSGIEETEKTSGEGDTDVTVQFDGDGYRIMAGIPEINGTSIRRTWNHPTGYCQEKNNQPTDSTSDDKTRFDRQAVSVEGVIDPRQPDVLTGTKTIKSDDGREETVITWRLKRCAPARVKSVTPAKTK
ncbi:MAG TPA: hypothetical protein VFA21_04725 [Pyrinomonadaceae bacterium]|nr:hypothetical protein [Pyrinomonadaceae bacterium]